MAYNITLPLLKFSALVIILSLCGAQWFKEVVLHLYLFISVPSYGSLYPVLYIWITSLCIWSFFFIPFIHSSVWRLLFVLPIIITFWFENAFSSIMNSPLDRAIIETFWNEYRSLSDIVAIHHYLPTLTITAALAIALAVVLTWPLSQQSTVPSFMLFLPMSVLAAIFFIPIEGVFPPFSTLLNLVHVISEPKYSGPRQGINYTGSVSPKIKNIIFIMDESVRGDYLTINNSALKITPYLESRKSDLISFGEGVSAANCSVQSRYIIRTGLQPPHLPDMDQFGLKMPSMWQYAKHAGYETIYIDGYAMTKNAIILNHSLMNSSERYSIDRNIPISTFPRYLRDSEIADEIINILANSKKPTFIFAEKSGAHYPYYKFYPPTYADSEGTFPLPNLNNPAHVKRSYRLAIQWSVDEFFRNLLPKIDFNNTMLIYTSDHGQSLFEGGYEMMHCSTTGVIHPKEASIPLVVITKEPFLESIFRSAATQHFNRTSHFQLFPTLLWLMGYEEAFVNRFGASLLSPPAQQQWEFFTGSLFSKKFRWIQGSVH